MNEIQEKITRLPTWVREHIKRLELQAQPNNNELIRLRCRVTVLEEQKRRLEDRISAMTDIFRSAARGGNETAQAYVNRVMDEYIEPDDENNG